MLLSRIRLMIIILASLSEEITDGESFSEKKELTYDMLYAAIPTTDNQDQYIDDGPDGLPAFGFREGADVKQPYRLCLPEKLPTEFTLVTTFKLLTQETSYIFAVLNPFDTIIQLGIRLSAVVESNQIISLIYTNSDDHSHSEEVAQFTVPSLYEKWSDMIIKISSTNITLYLNCHVIGARNITRNPQELVFDTASTLYIAQAGPHVREKFNGLLQTLRLHTGIQDNVTSCYHLEGNTMDIKSGQQGPKGEPGSSGSRGPKGDSGFPGPKGMRGETGPKGEKGHVGSPGPRGSKGEPGLVGLPGERGKPSDKGEKGDTGPPGHCSLTERVSSDILIDQGSLQYGASGTFGLRGYKGDAGTKGQKGEKGSCEKLETFGINKFLSSHSFRGEPGRDGSRGYQGPPGMKGDRGERGPPGIAYPDGSNNYLTLKGEKGNEGKRGRRGRPGLMGPPGPRSNVDVSESTLKGQKGEKGDQGIPGLPGNTGSMGPPGPPGLPGQSRMLSSTSTWEDNPTPKQPVQYVPNIIHVPIESDYEINGRAQKSFDQGSIPSVSKSVQEVTPRIVPGAVIFQDRKVLSKMSTISQVGTLAYIVDEEALLVKIDSGWQYISLGSSLVMPSLREPDVQLSTVPSPQGISNLISDRERITTDIETLPKNLKMLRIAALNDPTHGDMHGIKNSDYICHRQGLRAGFDGIFRALLSSRTHTIDEIMPSDDQNIPIVNLKREILFNSWREMTNPNGVYSTTKPRIYSFNGKDILTDFSWSQKKIWLGSPLIENRALDMDCDAWRSGKTEHYGLASSIKDGFFRETTHFSCENKFAVLCVEMKDEA